jgi:hypothetical protein
MVHFVHIKLGSKNTMCSSTTTSLPSGTIGSPGLMATRLTMGFFQVCWEVLKVNIMNVFHDFHARGMFGKTSIPPSFLLFRINQGLLILRIFDLLA